MLIHSGLLFVFYIHQTNLYVTKSGRKCPLKWLIDFLQFCVCWFSDQTLSNLLYTSLNLAKLFRLNLKIWGHCWADSGQCLLKMIKGWIPLVQEPAWDLKWTVAILASFLSQREHLRGQQSPMGILWTLYSTNILISMGKLFTNKLQYLVSRQNDVTCKTMTCINVNSKFSDIRISWSMCPLIYYAHPINLQHPRLLEYFAGIQKFLLVWTLRSLCSKSWQPGVQPKLHGTRKGYKPEMWPRKIWKWENMVYIYIYKETIKQENLKKPRTIISMPKT